MSDPTITRPLPDQAAIAMRLELAAGDLLSALHMVRTVQQRCDAEGAHTCSGLEALLAKAGIAVDRAAQELGGGGVAGVADWLAELGIELEAKEEAHG